MINFGTACSAGCIRLTIVDAWWIFHYVPSGTTVEFYSDSNPGPLGKPSAQKISNNIECRNWDPTDGTDGNPWHKATPTVTPSPMHTPTSTTTPTATPVLTISPTLVPNASPTISPTTNGTPSPTPSQTLTPAGTPNKTPTQAVTPTTKNTPNPSPEKTVNPTSTPTSSTEVKNDTVTNDKEKANTEANDLTSKKN